jgi:hypothetical protein
MRPIRALAFALLLPAACQRSAAAPRLDASDATPTPEAARFAGDASESATDASDGGSLAMLEDAAPVLGPRDPGPFEVPWPGTDAGARTVYWVAPTSRAKPQRLLANLHGICNPPGYACGYWVQAASEAGFLVCPTGNARCGAGQYNAPTWTIGDDGMDKDLEAAIAEIESRNPGEFSRDGAILTGFSKGAYAAVGIAKKHPGRWPYLILNEADVSLSAKVLRDAQVRAVALIAGEVSGQVAGEKRTAAALEKEGYPVKLWLMPKAGHFYSPDIDEIMRQAIAFVTAH